MSAALRIVCPCGFFAITDFDGIPHVVAIGAVRTVRPFDVGDASRGTAITLTPGAGPDVIYTRSTMADLARRFAAALDPTASSVHRGGMP